MTSTEYWSDSIRPVTAAIPASTEILDESNLPLAVSLTPLVSGKSKGNSDADAFYLSRIAKCLHCGAPHPTSTTHFRLGGSLLLCYLCGRVSSLSSTEQQAGRRREPDVNVDDNNEHRKSSSKSKKTGAGETYCLPLRLSSDGATKYSVPAMTCPPLWFILLDGSCPDRDYWSMIETSLKETLREAPPHVHVSLLVATSQRRKNVLEESPQKKSNASDNKAKRSIKKSDTDEDDDAFVSSLRLFQLSSPVPYFVEFSSEESCTEQDDLLQAVLGSCVPLEDCRDSIMYAINALPQMEASGQALPLAWSTQVVLSALEEGAVSAGRQSKRSSEKARSYAGGKLTVFLASKPAELGLAKAATTTSPGDGDKSLTVDPSDDEATNLLIGLGGRIHVGTAGSRFQSIDDTPAVSEGGAGDDIEAAPAAKDDDNALDAAEWTPEALEDYSDWDTVYSDLGKQCAAASLGVDLYFCGSQAECAVAVALCSHSGCVGPLLVKRYYAVPELQEQLLQRAPWNVVFGAELRVRLSPGLAVDTDPPVESTNKKKKDGRPHLANGYSQAGLVGPASPVEEGAQLWRMGVCDAQTNLTLDLTLPQPHIKETMLVNGVGEVALKPAIQTCFAYTTIVPDKKKDGVYHTVRRMRISSRRVPLAHRVEELYNTLDPEALAVVLFHKLALASFEDGYAETPDIAERWLQSLLVCAYRSAEDEEALQLEEKEKGMEETSVVSDLFVATERLLDHETGQLSASDVLLGMGHEKLASLPFLVFSLLQLDVFRPYGSPTLDARLAATWQLASMTPPVLGRAVAPRLQLWQSGAKSSKTSKRPDSPIVELLDLSSTAVQDAVMEFSATTTKPLLLFLDAPDQILVLNAAQVSAASNGRTAVANISAGLQQAIQDAVDSYRTAPPVLYELSSTSSGDTAESPVLLRLIDVLIQDAPSSQDESYAEWRTRMATAVEEELEGST